jgi:hypothetical protein
MKMEPTRGNMDSREPSAPRHRPAGVDPIVRGPRPGAVRQALGEHDRRSYGVPATRDALARATATEARSVAEPWSTAVDRAARMLACHATREG